MKKPSEMTTPELLNWSGQVMHGEIEIGRVTAAVIQSLNSSTSETEGMYSATSAAKARALGGALPPSRP